MINTLSLSSDMQTLYLIDNGRAIAFPLNKDKGILVGTLNGQITVATAAKSPDGRESSEPGSGNPANAIPTIAGATGGAKRAVKLSLPDSQWTIAYNEKHESVFFMGLTEIDIGIAGPDPSFKPSFHVFNLKGVVLNLRLVDNIILVFPLIRR